MTIRRRRQATAREVAEKFGVSIRTVKYLVSELREDYEGRAKSRRQQAHDLHQQGMSWAEVGQAMDCSPEAAKQLGKRFRAMQSHT